MRLLVELCEDELSLPAAQGVLSTLRSFGGQLDLSITSPNSSQATKMQLDQIVGSLYSGLPKFSGFTAPVLGKGQQQRQDVGLPEFERYPSAHPYHPSPDAQYRTEGAAWKQQVDMQQHEQCSAPTLSAWMPQQTAASPQETHRTSMAPSAANMLTDMYSIYAAAGLDLEDMPLESVAPLPQASAQGPSSDTQCQPVPASEDGTAILPSMPGMEAATGQLSEPLVQAGPTAANVAAIGAATSEMGPTHENAAAAAAAAAAVAALVAAGIEQPGQGKQQKQGAKAAAAAADDAQVHPDQGKAAAKGKGAATSSKAKGGNAAGGKNRKLAGLLLATVEEPAAESSKAPRVSAIDAALAAVAASETVVVKPAARRVGGPSKPEAPAPQKPEGAVTAKIEQASKETAVGSKPAVGNGVSKPTDDNGVSKPAAADSPAGLAVEAPMPEAALPEPELCAPASSGVTMEALEQQLYAEEYSPQKQDIRPHLQPTRNHKAKQKPQPVQPAQGGRVSPQHEVQNLKQEQPLVTGKVQHRQEPQQTVPQQPAAAGPSQPAKQLPPKAANAAAGAGKPANLAGPKVVAHADKKPASVSLADFIAEVNKRKRGKADTDAKATAVPSAWGNVPKPPVVPLQSIAAAESKNSTVAAPPRATAKESWVFAKIGGDGKQGAAAAGHVAGQETAQAANTAQIAGNVGCDTAGTAGAIQTGDDVELEAADKTVVHEAVEAAVKTVVTKTDEAALSEKDKAELKKSGMAADKDADKTVVKKIGMAWSSTYAKSCAAIQLVRAAEKPADKQTVVRAADKQTVVTAAEKHADKPQHMQTGDMNGQGAGGPSAQAAGNHVDEDMTGQSSGKQEHEAHTQPSGPVPQQLAIQQQQQRTSGVQQVSGDITAPEVDGRTEQQSAATAGPEHVAPGTGAVLAAAAIYREQVAPQAERAGFATAGSQQAAVVTDADKAAASSPAAGAAAADACAADTAATAAADAEAVDAVTIAAATQPAIRPSSAGLRASAPQWTPSGGSNATSRSGSTSKIAPAQQASTEPAAPSLNISAAPFQPPTAGSGLSTAAQEWGGGRHQMVDGEEEYEEAEEEKGVWCATEMPVVPGMLPCPMPGFMPGVAPGAMLMHHMAPGWRPGLPPPAHQFWPPTMHMPHLAPMLGPLPAPNVLPPAYLPHPMMHAPGAPPLPPAPPPPAPPLPPLAPPTHPLKEKELLQDATITRLARCAANWCVVLSYHLHQGIVIQHVTSEELLKLWQTGALHVQTLMVGSHGPLPQHPPAEVFRPLALLACMIRCGQEYQPVVSVLDEHGAPHVVVPGMDWCMPPCLFAAEDGDTDAKQTNETEQGDVGVQNLLSTCPYWMVLEHYDERGTWRTASGCSPSKQATTLLLTARDPGLGFVPMFPLAGVVPPRSWAPTALFLPFAVLRAGSQSRKHRVRGLTLPQMSTVVSDNRLIFKPELS